jgi:tetratricopeptide (TPR) repeat protein
VTHHRPAVHRAIAVVDVEKFGDPARTNAHQLIIRDRLYRILEQTFAQAGIPWTACDSEDRGDGALILVPPEIPKSLLVARLPDLLVVALRRHNESQPAPTRIRLRVALHAGEVTYDAQGVVGESVNHTFRLLEAPVLKEALATADDPVALMVSAWFYGDVVRHLPGDLGLAYTRVRVEVKETQVWAWLRLPDGAGAEPSTVDSLDARRDRRDEQIFDVLSRNRNFTGRDAQLQDIRDQLVAEGDGSVGTIALHGLGGVGKSQLALEYAYRYAGDYDIVCWVPAADRASVCARLDAMARRLGVAESASPEKGAAALWDVLRQHYRWLLVYDDAEDPRELARYWPRGGAGHVIVTSRNPNWQALATPYEVRVFTRDEAVAFLREHTREGEQPPGAVDSLAAALGDLPLALEQARAYMEATAIGARGYLDLLREHDRELLGLGEPAGTDHTVATTWRVSLDRLRAEAPDAEDLLSLCAFLGPQDIPWALLRHHAELLPDRLARTLRHPLLWNKAVSVVSRYSLARITRQAFEVHLLLQAVIRNLLPDDERRAWAAKAARLVEGAFPSVVDDVGTWTACEALLPHAVASTGYAVAAEAAPDVAARLLTWAARHLRRIGDLRRARELQVRALEVREQHAEPDDPVIADSLVELGATDRELGDLTAATRSFERALAIRNARQGNRTLGVADVLTWLGLIRYDTDDLAGARAVLETALAIEEARADTDPLLVARTVIVLGLVQRSLNHLEAARLSQERALGIRISHLGRVLLDLRQLADARECNERALFIRETRLGPHHPHVAASLNHLGYVLRELGRLDAAAAAHARAHDLAVGLFGPRHSHVARSLEGLGVVLLRQGRAAEARDQLALALDIFEAELGPEHRTVAVCLGHLGLALRALGDLDGARDASKRALDIFTVKTRLSPNHPDVRTVRSQLDAIVDDEP